MQVIVLPVPDMVPSGGGVGVAIRSDPYHSVNPTDPDVHHTYWHCPNGQQIRPENKRWGTNAWPKCGSCKRLDQSR